MLLLLFEFHPYAPRGKEPDPAAARRAANLAAVASAMREQAEQKEALDVSNEIDSAFT